MLGKKLIAIVAVVVIIGAAAGLLAYRQYHGEEAPQTLLLATTTSTYDSGLLDHILPDFEAKHDCEVKVTAVGTGQALEMGKNGDADVLLVHSRTREEAFVADGYGLYRRDVMYNQFVIVGPITDPAGIAGGTDAEAALRAIKAAGATFCSRGDDSGTHGKERAVWEAAGYDYTGISDKSNSSWYMSLGAGMGDTLRTAHELGAYTLADEGTFYAMEGELDLVILVRGDGVLFNQYGAMPVNPDGHQNVNSEMGQAFAEWITSAPVQEMIDGYVRNGHQLFTANAGR